MTTKPSDTPRTDLEIEMTGMQDYQCWPDDVRARSAETVSIIMEKLALEGLTLPQLKKLARKAA